MSALLDIFFKFADSIKDILYLDIFFEKITYFFKSPQIPSKPIFKVIDPLTLARGVQEIRVNPLQKIQNVEGMSLFYKSFPRYRPFPEMNSFPYINSFPYVRPIICVKEL